MATPSINGTAVPITAAMGEMGQIGRYKFTPQEKLRENGQGDAIVAGPQIATWRWQVLPEAAYQWWATTIMSGDPSIRLTAAELWDDEHNEVTFTEGVLYRPVAESHESGLYLNVTVTIKHLVPLIW